MQQLTLAQAFARAPGQTSRPQKVDTVLPKKSAQKVLFGPNGPYADFDQFSLHPVNYNAVIYPTSQHLFQAFKFLGHHPDLAENIRMAPTAELAFNIAHANKSSVRSDWNSINISKMEEALFLKFSQYPFLQQELLSTGDSELYQDSMTDSFWAVGGDLLGRNEFGRALERVRESLGGSKATARKVLQCQVYLSQLPSTSSYPFNQNCRKKPRLAESLYCGNSCLRADILTVPPLCPQCRRRPQIGKLKYCGETCRKAARA
ncbi:DUF1768-domain-containing protein [Mycena leptocephala]|nr:DUF1768-domain-containing protein [Mycena leptocephala]